MSEVEERRAQFRAHINSAFARSPESENGTSALGWPLEIVAHEPGSGVGILQAGRDVSAGVVESPDVD